MFTTSAAEMSSLSFTTGPALSDSPPGTCENCTIGDGRQDIDPGILAEISRLTNLALIITLVCYIPILVLGLFGNSVSFVLMIKRAGNSSTYTYLCSLAVLDNVFLIRTVGTWIVYSATSGETDMRQILDCNFMAILLYISKESSVWLRVAVSVERALVIYLPTRAKAVTNVRRARAVVAAILLLTAISNWQAFGAYRTVRGGVESGAGVCPGRTPWLHYYNSIIQGWIDATLYAYVPIVCLVVLNGAIVAKFASAARHNKVNPTVSQAMAKHSRRLTMICLTLSGTFLVLTLPHTVHNLWFRSASDMASTDPVAFYTQFLISQILSILYRTNHAINMALYCMTSAKFQQNLRRLLTCRTRQGDTDSSAGPNRNNRTGNGGTDNSGTRPTGSTQETPFNHS